MKSDSAFLLENANWPVLVVNCSGVILRTNRAAASHFPNLTQAGGAGFAAVWHSSNRLSLQEYLAQAVATASMTPVRLITQARGTMSFMACAAPFAAEATPEILIQLLPATASSGEVHAPSETGPLPVNSATDGGAIQKQKLECALQLTRTVALDFNNALTSILGHTSLILSKMEATHPWRGSLVEVEKSAEKAAEVASDLAAFSRQEKDTRSQVAGNLNEVLRRTVELFERPGARPIQWRVELEARLFTVTFEEAKMQQAFVKILDNAVQAISERGQITVRTRNHEISGTAQEPNLKLAPGHYVCVEFEDNGCGIPAEVLPRIFEPFFTTKESPHHRGLGLAWVYGIITNHGGSVAVSSQVQQGTTVRVYLPAQKKIVRDRTLSTDDLNGSQTILMVDDEELLLTMGEMVLSSFGYRVLTANSGQRALEIFAEPGRQIDLVITDLVMPKMSGRELIEQLHRLAPNIKIICSSGYIRALNPEEEELYLQKPFTSLDLLRKVKHVLTSADGS